MKKIIISTIIICLSHIMFAQIPVDGKPVGLIKLAHAYLRAEPRHGSELITEAVMGTPVCVLEKAKDGWFHIQTPDGYRSYVHPESIWIGDEGALNTWKKSKRFIFRALQGYIYETKNDRGNIVSDIFNGGIVAANSEDKSNRKWVAVILPDGRKGYAKRSEVEDFQTWAKNAPKMKIEDRICDIGMKMLGRTYLWGGMTYNVDCSGFSRLIYSAAGILLPRDASPQSKVGLEIDTNDMSSWQPGDLIFFGNNTTGRVNHVAIHLHNGKFIHSSGRVKINSLNPDDSDCFTQSKPIVVRRIIGSVGTQSIMYYRDHPWYF